MKVNGLGEICTLPVQRIIDRPILLLERFE
jgi:hypothetical protein